MGATIRCRFVALDLTEGWIELTKKGLWTVRHVERRGVLSLSMFPVAEGVVMDLATVRSLSREAQARRDDLLRRFPALGPFSQRSVVLGETYWTQGSVFCLATSTRTERRTSGENPFEWPDRDPVSYATHWTVSDGTYVLEASFREFDEEHFRTGVEECAAMMRSVRFEGPS